MTWGHKNMIDIALNASTIVEAPSNIIGEQKVYFYFFKRTERSNQEVLSHSFICLPLPHMEVNVLICNIDLYCAITIFSGTGDMFNR